MKKKRDDDNTQRPLWGVRGVKGGVAAHPRGGTGSAPVGFFLPFKIQTFVFFFFFHSFVFITSGGPSDAAQILL